MTGSSDNSTHEKNDSVATAAKTTKKTTKKKILGILMDDPYKSAKDIAEELGITSDSVRYHISKLRKEGVIHLEGPNRGSYCVIDADGQKSDE